jgi:SecD/SecF fusion protein
VTEEKATEDKKAGDTKADSQTSEEKDSEKAPPAEKNADEKKAESNVPGATAPSATAPPATSPAPSAEVSPGSPAAAPGSTTTLAVVDLKFGHAINAPTLRAEIEETAQQLGIPLSYFDLQNPQWDGIGSNSYASWSLRLATSQENAKRILDELTQQFASEPVWPSSSTVGPMVAGRMQRMAIMALIASWIGIIVYVWFRFQNLVFGLAAVLALVHDVLITVAALAVSYWLAGPLNFLLVEDFKIGLTIIAALLTIIGFSINDTIVIFDRIREVRGKSPEVTADMVNLSVNQTLGRTLLTFFTVFIVVVCLYVLGGQGIHGFAFAMLIGLLSGTYSTVFIATPFVLWLAGKRIEEPAPKPMGVPERSLR